MHHVQITDNGGRIVATNSSVDIHDTAVGGNDLPYGAALEIAFNSSDRSFNTVTLNDNRIAGNLLAPGAVPLQITNDRPSTSVVFDIQRNVFGGQDGPDFTLNANGRVQGNVTCNTFAGGANGISVHSNQPQTFSTFLNIRDNAVEQHTPPLDPFFRQNHIGRGAASEIELNMDGNWWGDPTGPYVPDRHPEGRGDAVGANISFANWRTERPACAPSP